MLQKVTLSTVHAAKGLEWAVVFVPACENGCFPFYRSESPNEIDEERRLLYVAITRAQGFCTLSHSMTRMTGGEPLFPRLPVSPFRADPAAATLQPPFRRRSFHPSSPPSPRPIPPSSSSVCRRLEQLLAPRWLVCSVDQRRARRSLCKSSRHSECSLFSLCHAAD